MVSPCLSFCPSPDCARAEDDIAVRDVVRALVAAGMPDRPTALVFDNDVMALAALHEAGRLGLTVPADISLVAWDDSATPATRGSSI